MKSKNRNWANSFCSVLFFVGSAVQAADSTIENPHDFRSPASFVDDFSNPDSTALGYNHYTEADAPAQSSIRYLEGAVQIAIHSPDNEYGGGTLYVNDNTSDSIHARLSLSSDSSLPVDDEASAKIAIDAVLYNDSFESADNRAGDIEFRIGLQQRGDGRISINYWANRRSAEGESIDLRLWETPGFDAFDALQPALDTAYDFTLELDRVRSVVRMSVGDTSAEYPLASIYGPYRHQMRIHAQHRGSSGRAVGSVHHLITDDFDINFADAVPAIASLDPQWDARFADSSVDWADQRLTLTVDASKHGRGRATLSTGHSTDFLGADLELSSSSNPAVGEKNTLGIGATLFNDTAPNSNADGSEQAGASFASVQLVDSSDAAIYATYCYWRFDGENWVEQVSGSTTDCDNRFSDPIEYDISYPASVYLDRDKRQLVWSLNGVEYKRALSAGIFDTTAQYYRTRVTAAGHSLAIGHVDNLRFGLDASVLAESPDRLLLGPDDGAPSVVADSGGSSGGGGSLHPLLLLLIAAAFIGCSRRRASVLRGHRATLAAGLIFAVLTGCKTNPTYMAATTVLEPMEKIDYSVPLRVSVQSSKRDGNSYNEQRALPDGLVEARDESGCLWVFSDVFQPSVSWQNCFHPQAKWRSGKSEDLVLTGEPWPLEVGKKFSYRFAYVDANGKKNKPNIRKCEVHETVHLKLPIGDMDAYEVRCRDSSSGSWWIKRNLYLNPEHGLVKLQKIHSSRGMEIDWEIISNEPL